MIATNPMRSEQVSRWAFRLGFGLVTFLSLYLLTH